MSTILKVASGGEPHQDHRRRHRQKPWLGSDIVEGQCCGLEFLFDGSEGRVLGGSP